MKFILIALFVCLAVQIECRNLKVHHNDVGSAVEHQAGKNLDLNFCKACIDFADQALDYLLNAVINIGIVGSCGELCQYVQDKTGSGALGLVCDLLCDFVGIDEFIKILDRVDLDPIWYCELLKSCPVNDHGDAKITTLMVAPQRGPQGTFTIDLEYVSKNGTSTGELFIDIKTPDRIPLEDGFIMENSPAGKYGEKISLQAKPNPDCDPSAGPCESWQPGTYVVEIALCAGECGSKHPHSKIYDIQRTNFTIV